MKRLQKGFTTIEVLLLLIILAIIGGTGYYVWHSRQQADQTLNTASNETSAVKVNNQSKSGTASTKYFTISQWGVRAPQSGDITLEYAIVKGNGGPDYAKFSSAQLDKIGNTCKTSADYGGIIDRYSSSEHFLVGDGGVDSGKTAAQYATTLQAGTYAHVGDFYYFYESPQALCPDIQSNDTNGQKVQSDTQAAVKAVVTNLQQVAQ